MAGSSKRFSIAGYELPKFLLKIGKTSVIENVLNTYNDNDDFKSRAGVSLTYTPMLIDASIRAIQEYPLLNTSLDSDNIVYHRNINMGVAVALPDPGGAHRTDPRHPFYCRRAAFRAAFGVWTISVGDVGRGTDALGRDRGVRGGDRVVGLALRSALLRRLSRLRSRALELRDGAGVALRRGRGAREGLY